MTYRPRPGVLLFAALLAGSRAAAADPSDSEVSERAQALFDRGVADMEAGRFEKACPAIEASQRLEPMPGTLFTLAECEAQRGRSATAMRYYAEYLTLYRAFTPRKKLEQRDRAVTSEEQLQKLEAIVPRLTLKLRGGSRPDVVVKRNGEIVAELSLGTPIAVNPGSHVITTKAPAGPEVAVRVSIAAGESKTLELDVASRPPNLPEQAPTRIPTVALTLPAADPVPWKVGTITTGAAALIGLTVGVVAGVFALQQQDIVKEHCPRRGGVRECDTTGFEAKTRLEMFGNASTVAFAAGGASGAVSLGLWLGAPSSGVEDEEARRRPSSPSALAPTGLTISGTF